MMPNSSSSSFFNDSLPHPHISSINFSLPQHMFCYTSRPSSLIFIAFLVSYTIFILPLSIFILFHGLQQWLKKRSTSSATVMSHSDCFVYHSVTIELIGTCGSILFICGVRYEDLQMLLGGTCLLSLIWHGQTFFHVLTCVERYLAVVHPITYRNLKNERGIRIRNISIGCIWLLCFVAMGLMLEENAINILDVCILVMAVLITPFCSVSVLCVLIRPGPKEQDGDREKVDQSRQRAFKTIVIILGVLVIRFTWGLVRVLHMINGNRSCVTVISSFWLYIPSSLVLPVLFLHRTGKIMCCKNTSSQNK